LGRRPSRREEASVPTRIELPGLRELIASGAQLVEVLPGENFAEYHLPGAINLPLITLDARSAAVLDRGRPIVVYCYDGL
jgi:phage shock protein E